MFLLVVSSAPPPPECQLHSRKDLVVMFSGTSTASRIVRGTQHIPNKWMTRRLDSWMNVSYFLESLSHEKFSLTLLGRLDSLL